MTKQRAAHGLTLVGASAGSGKTYRLTAEVTNAVKPTSAGAISPEELVAVTYTRRAASELGARIRRTLVSEGAYEGAQRLPLAYLGTVHAVCLRFVQELALDAGLSPEVDVLAGQEARLLREALEWGLDPDLRARVQALAESVELRWNPTIRRIDWHTPVQDIMTLARSNRIAPDALPAMAARSAAGLLALLGTPENDGAALDAELREELKKAAAAVHKHHDGKGNTTEALETLDEVADRDSRGELLWSDWVRLQKVKPSKAIAPLVEPLVAVAVRVDRHPRFQAEVRELTTLLYESAREGLIAYDDWKKRRRVVDFVDMVDRALTLLDRPEIAEELRHRLKLVVVDEFQDTSPLQLALFAKLHQITQRSTWVGDRKQCIFEFAGADPALMEAVSTWVVEQGGVPEQLPGNWRSRPELVTACSSLFSAAFARHGFRAHEVEVQARRADPVGLACLPAFGVWSLAVKNQDDEAESLAEGIRRLVELPRATPVIDHVTNEARSLRPGDIAVLVATNAQLVRLAAALAARGIRATVARARLLATPEGTLVNAALRVLVDARDGGARAEIEALTGFGGKTPEAWLESRILAATAARKARDEGEAPPETISDVHVARVEALRKDILALAPSEALERVLDVLNLVATAARWSAPEQRMSNLDALRALTAEYEQSCAQQREAATVAGLLRFFAESAREVLVRDEQRASDDQHTAASDHAVNLTTYHRAKGLEWPVVVLGSLDRSERRDAFDVCPMTDRPTFDAADPLGGRWVRYWPWPFGSQKKTRLAEAAATSATGLDVAEREDRERVRLLYVGFTRARDHLILAARVKASGGHATYWLDSLRDEKDQGLVGLPSAEDGDGTAVVRLTGPGGLVTNANARHWTLGVGEKPPVRMPVAEDRRWFAYPIPKPDDVVSQGPQYWISPSRLGKDDAMFGAPKPGAPERIGDRLPLGDSAGVDWDVVGNAVHSFLACDLPGMSDEARVERAKRLLDAARLAALLAPESLLKTSDQLRAWVDSRWPGATWHREYPVTAVVASEHGARRIDGTIDLLLETSEGVVIIDHKSYPGAAASWAQKAGTFAGQLGAYAHVLRAAGKNVLGAYVNFAIGGGVVPME